MVTDDLANWFKHDELANFERAFTFLADADLVSLAEGTHPILGDEVYAIVARRMSRSPNEGQFEAHNKHLDIHFLVSGEENIHVADRDKLIVSTPYDDEKDVMFFETPLNYQVITLRKSHFAIIYPHEAHLPLCQTEAPMFLHKVVVKIKIAE